MPLIQDPGPGRKLQRGLRLTSLPDAILAPEIVGVIILEDYSGSDIALGCSGAATAGSVAAEFPMISLSRVGGLSGYDLIVTAFHFSTLSNQRMALVAPTVALAGMTASPEKNFDDLGVPGQPTSELGFDTQVAIPAGQFIRRAACLASTSYRWPLNIRIASEAEGAGRSSIFIVGELVNSTIFGGFEWTEGPPLG